MPEGNMKASFALQSQGALFCLKSATAVIQASLLSNSCQSEVVEHMLSSVTGALLAG